MSRVLRSLSFAPFCLALLGLGLVACGGETAEEKMNRQLGEAVSNAVGESGGVDIDAQGMQQALQEFGNSFDSTTLGTGEVINFRELKVLLPATLAGLPRTEHLGETNGVMGLTISEATAVYEAGERRVDAKILDTGGAGILTLSMAAFANMTVDKETAEGSERTLKIDGFPAYEKYSSTQGTSELSVLVNKRFLVSLEGRGVDVAELTRAFRGLSLGGLPAVK